MSAASAWSRTPTIAPNNMSTTVQKSSIAFLPTLSINRTVKIEAAAIIMLTIIDDKKGVKSTLQNIVADE